MQPPAGYENDLAPYAPCLFDSACGEPVAWGFKILRRLGDDRFNALAQFGKLECSYPHWFLIVKELTREEAVAKYGAISAEEFGPRGGWKSITFGDKKFLSKRLKVDPSGA